MTCNAKSKPTDRKKTDDVLDSSPPTEDMRGDHDIDPTLTEKPLGSKGKKRVRIHESHSPPAPKRIRNKREVDVMLDCVKTIKENLMKIQASVKKRQGHIYDLRAELESFKNVWTDFETSETEEGMGMEVDD